MEWKDVAARAKKVMDERGGPQSVEEDAQELLDIARGEGTLTDKLGRAVKAVKEPGAHHEAPPGPATPGAEPDAPAAQSPQEPSQTGASDTPEPGAT